MQRYSYGKNDAFSKLLSVLNINALTNHKLLLGHFIASRSLPEPISFMVALQSLLQSLHLWVKLTVIRQQQGANYVHIS